MAGLDVKIFHRDSVIKLMSLVHKQFGSPRFRPMWIYAWHKAGYLDERPVEFLNPVQYCFSDRSGADSCCFCRQPEFVKCGWCTRLLCFDHFWGGSDDFGHLCSELV